MFTEDHLTFRSSFLESKQNWGLKGSGLLFLFPKTGTAEVWMGTKRAKVRPGDALVANLSAGGSLRGLPKAGLTFESFSISLEHLFPMFGAEEISLLNQVTESLSSFRIYADADSVARQCQRLLAQLPPKGGLEHRGQLLQVAAVVLTDIFAKARRDLGGYGGREHWRNILKSLSTAEVLSLSMDQLAARFSCSKRQLNRLFHEHFHLSVAALKMETRMLKAISLLRHPDAKVLNVAAECGFNHLGLFNTCFRKRFGATPSQWRNQAQRKPERQRKAPETVECLLRRSGVCPAPASTQ
jgi:AraC-like DNA-binding protein